jgi:putative SOS response-associated peptidase YedK
VLAFAGLIETYAEPGGSEMDTGAIITTEANAGIAHIHDRMPVMIEERDFARWLDCRTQEPRDVLDLLKPAEPDFFEAVPVSDLVNKVASTGPEIQERGIVSPQAEKPRRQMPGADENQMSLF